MNKQTVGFVTAGIGAMVALTPLLPTVNVPLLGSITVVMTLAESPQRCSSEFPTCGLV